MTLLPAMAAMWTTVFILSSVSVTGVSGQYVSKLRDCPSYVAEKTSRDACVCYYDGPQNLVASIYTQWTGQDSVRSTSSTLRLESVTRGDDGKQYTCRVTGIPGQTVAPSVFTLHVAYGPAEGDVNISQSRVDPTASNGGVTRFHLTCSASDVSPPPRFSWTGLTCANNNHHTCVFTPDPAIPDPRNATCTVSPSVTGLGIAPVSNTIPLDLTYKTVITSLTLDDVENTLTVNLTGSTPLSVQLRCQVFGHPRPDSVNLTKFDGDLDPTRVQDGPGPWSREATVTLSVKKCRDLGTYGCTAGNGVGPVATSTVLLDGDCQPQPLSSDFQIVTTGGATFDLEAFPVPDTSNLTFLRRNLIIRNGAVSDLDEEGEMALDSFTVKCEGGVGGRKWRVRCTVTARPQARLGLYRLEIDNGLGRVVVPFYYLKSGDSTDGSGTAWYWYVFSGASDGIVIICVIVVPVVMARKRRCSKRPKDDDNGHPQGSENVACRQDQRSPGSVKNIYELDDAPLTDPGQGRGVKETAPGPEPGRVARLTAPGPEPGRVARLTAPGPEPGRVARLAAITFGQVRGAKQTATGPQNIAIQQNKDQQGLACKNIKQEPQYNTTNFTSGDKHVYTGLELAERQGTNASYHPPTQLESQYDTTGPNLTRDDIHVYTGLESTKR